MAHTPLSEGAGQGPRALSGQAVPPAPDAFEATAGVQPRAARPPAAMRGTIVAWCGHAARPPAGTGGLRADATRPARGRPRGDRRPQAAGGPSTASQRWRGAAIPAALVLLVVLVPGPAAAHAPIAGIGTFWNGALHPLLVPLHLLVLAAAGLAVGLDAPRASRVALPVFAVLLAAALAAAGQAGTAPAVLLALALAGGILVAVGRALPAPAVAMAAATALAIGLDSAPVETPAGEGWVAAVGTWSGAVLAFTLCAGFAAGLVRPLQRIAIRALGSWIAAVAVIVLALVLSGRGAVS